MVSVRGPGSTVRRCGQFHTSVETLEAVSEGEQQVAKEGPLISVLLVKRQPAHRHGEVVHEVDEKGRLAVARGSVDHRQTMVDVAKENVKEPVAGGSVGPTPGH